MKVVSWLPCVITFGVSLPFYEILQLSFPSLTSVVPDGLDLVLFYVIDKVRWWSGEVFSVFFCFDVWGKKGGVENGVDSPLMGKVEFIRYWR